MRSLWISSMLLLCGVYALAQSDRGTITGTVLDPAGAVVPNAPIEAKNTATGAVYRMATSETGNYTLSQLPVGTYEISVSAPGFNYSVVNDPRSRSPTAYAAERASGGFIACAANAHRRRPGLLSTASLLNPLPPRRHRGTERNWSGILLCPLVLCLLWEAAPRAD